MIAKMRETGMASRLEAYRVQAYNTAKLSENKMHDDTVARRFGFSGGLVPGVDVMAYMMHLPVAMQLLTSILMVTEYRMLMTRIVIMMVLPM